MHGRSRAYEDTPGKWGGGVKGGSKKEKRRGDYPKTRGKVLTRSERVGGGGGLQKTN